MTTINFRSIISNASTFSHTLIKDVAKFTLQSQQPVATPKDKRIENESIRLETLVSVIRDGVGMAHAQRCQSIKELAIKLYETESTTEQQASIKDEIDRKKSNLPFIIPSGYKLKGHGLTGDAIEFNGFIQIDIDTHFTNGLQLAKGIKQFIKAAAAKLPFIALGFESPTYGLKLIVKTDLDVTTKDYADQYKTAQQQVITYLSKVLNLGTNLFDATNAGKTMYLSIDKDVYFNLEPQAFKVDLTDYKTEKRAQIERKAQFESTISNSFTLDAAKWLIENSIDITVGNENYVKTLGACFYEWGVEGEDIARALSEVSPKFKESEFRTRFRSFKNSNCDRPSTGAYIRNEAIKSGFKPTYQTTPPLAVPIEAYTPNNLDFLVIHREKALNLVKSDTAYKIIVCEKSYINEVEKALNGQNFSVCTYQDVSKMPYDESLNVYVFGSQNLIRRNYVDALNGIEKATKVSRTVFFSDTKIHLPCSKQTFLIDVPTQNIEVIESIDPKSTFIELCNNDSNACYLETSESINKQLQGEKIKRTELYNVDKSKTLYVHYDSNCGMVLEHFAGFQKVVLVANTEVKECQSMTTFCNSNDKMVNDFLQMVDNEIFYTTVEKNFTETIKNKILAVKKENDIWVRCRNTAFMLENEHQIKILTSNTAELKKYVERLNNAPIIVQTAIITEKTLQIAQAIEQTKKDLAAEKKTEFFDFMETIEKLNISNMSDLSVFVSGQGENMKRGHKIAYNRIKTLCKVNDSFSMCVEAVKESYNNWVQTKGRFYAAKVIKGKGKISNALNILKDTTDGQLFEKAELIDLASKLNLISGDDKTKWKQLKRIGHIRGVQKRTYEGIKKLYELEFL